MRFVDEQIAEGITDEHDLANRTLDWYSRACDDSARTRVVQHASGQQTLPHFTQLANYLVRAIAAATSPRRIVPSRPPASAAPRASTNAGPDVILTDQLRASSASSKLVSRVAA